MLKDFERRAMSMEDLDAKRQTKIAELERQMNDWERMGPEETEQDQFTRPKEVQQKDEEAMQNDQEAPEALQAFKAADEAEQVKALLEDLCEGTQEAQGQAAETLMHLARKQINHHGSRFHKVDSARVGAHRLKPFS